MNKKIKRILAIALTISAFLVIEPAKYNDLMITEAYAAENLGISDLKVCADTGSSSIKMYKNSDYSTPTRFESNIFKYYIKLSRYVGEFNVKASVDSGYTVKVIDKSDDNKEYDLEEGISVKKLNTETITVEITKNDDLSKRTVSLRVYRDGEDGSSNEEQDTNNDIYLKDVTLSHSGNSIKLDFKPETDTYNVDVDESINNIKVEVNPDNNDDKIRINESSVSESNGYKKIVTINQGKNELLIKVKNYDEERTYTINVTRGSNPENINENTSAKLNQWVKINGLWQYNDAKGNPVKNTWIQNYYLKADGNMAIEWLNINESWYYFGIDGAKKIGWQKVNGTWYFLDTAEGKMKTGWHKDSDGKWYYLDGNGSMAYSTTVGGYRLGSSGAWIN